MCLLIFPPIGFCDFNIPLLWFLISATKQKDKCIFNLTKIDAISWSKVETQFKNTSTDRLAITKIAIFKPRKSFVNSLLRIFISNGFKPFRERFFAVSGTVILYFYWLSVPIDNRSIPAVQWKINSSLISNYTSFSIKNARYICLRNCSESLNSCSYKNIL